MKNLKIAVMALFIFAGVSKMNAQDTNNPWAVSIGVNGVDKAFHGLNSPVKALKDYVGIFSDVDVLPSISRVAVSRYLDNGFSVELAGSINKMKKETTTDLSFFAIDAAAKYDLNHLNFIGETGWFDPYVSLGAGVSWIEDNTAITINPGLGFNTWFNNTLGLNFQTAYKSASFTGGKIFDRGQQSYFQHSISLTYRFGAVDSDGDGVSDKKDLCPDVAGLVQFNGCPDTDGDGIVDAEDKCPNIAGTAAFNGCVDSDGDGIVDADDKCPKDKGTKANGGCPDTDGDGVIDSKDKCPKVAGVKSNNGCPAEVVKVQDADKDGVADADDKCPNVAGPASNKGCPELTAAAVKSIGDFAKTLYFNTGKDTFKPGATEKLDGIVAIMAEFKSASFNINGYTDNTGSKEKNLEISKARAAAVKNYLVSKGIDAKRLNADGFGIENPIESNATAAGRAANRRVEVIIIK